jgi:hypothetical protein
LISFVDPVRGTINIKVTFHHSFVITPHEKQDADNQGADPNITFFHDYKSLAN